MSLKINILPAMRQLCALDNTCPTEEGRDQIKRALAAIPSRVHSQSATFSYPTRLGFVTSNTLTSSMLQPMDYERVISSIEKILDSKTLPFKYRSLLIQPFYERLCARDGERWFALNISKGNEESVMGNIVRAILQNFSNDAGTIPQENTKALREIISDLYQTFLQTKCKVDKGRNCTVIPSPVPNWSLSGLSTYANIQDIINTKISIVNVPTRYATQAILTWGCLGHEVGGHDILGAYPGVLEELKEIIQDKMTAQRLAKISPYWTRWLEEGASDVMQVLHLGPAGAFSLIGFLRAEGSNKGYKLATLGYIDDEHPVDIIRGFVLQAAVRLLPSTKFRKVSFYADLIQNELEKDIEDGKKIWVDQIPTSLATKAPSDLFKLHQFIRHNKWFIEETQNKLPLKINRPVRNENFGLNKIKMEGYAFTLDECKTSAYIFAQTVMHSPLKALGGKSFAEIRAWSDTDEKICAAFQAMFQVEGEMVVEYTEQYGAHVVAAAIMESISEREGEPLNEARLQVIFNKMIAMLNRLNASNPEWKASVSDSPSSSTRHSVTSPKRHLRAVQDIGY